MVRRPTAGIILAAGTATRFGRPKQLIRLGDRHLLSWVLESSLRSKLEHVVLVLGYESQRIMTALADNLHHPRLRVVTNENYRQGMSESLRAGLLSVRDAFPSVMFLLGDQPLVGSEVIDLLLDQFWCSEKDICVPVYRGRRGNPTVFSKIFYHQILSISGDTGARTIILENPDRVLSVEIEDPNCFLDIDSEEDLNTFMSLVQSVNGEQLG